MTTRRRPATLFTVLVVVAAVLAAGCSGDDDDRDAAATSTTTTSVAAPAGGEQPPEAENAANAVTIDMTEYAFAVSGSLRAGTSTVVMKNSGQEMHMTGFALLRDGKSVDDARKALASEDEAAFDDVFERELDAPGGLLSPGQTMEVTTPFLDAGNYALMCFLPTVGEAVPHTAKGMIAGLTVTAGDVELKPVPQARYAIDSGRIDGPATLPAGRTTIEMSSGGTGPHEFIVARKKAPTTTFEQIEDAFTALFDSETPPAPGYAEKLPAVIVGNSFDVETGNSVFMTLELQPGQYLIGCARQPEEESPEAGEAHLGELLEVRVT